MRGATSLAGMLVLSLIQICSAQLKWEARQLSLAPKPGEKQVVAEFAFKNTGNYPVAITSVATSCDCTTATPGKKVYAPGENGTIKTIFTVGRRHGEQNKTITIATDDKAAPRVALNMKISLPKVLELSPRLVRWAEHESPAPKTIRITVVQETPLIITGIERVGRASPMSAEVKEVVRGKEYVVTITPASTSDAALGVFDIKTQPSGEDVPRFRVYSVIGRPMPPTPATKTSH